jgi:hypothetical protein
MYAADPRITFIPASREQVGSVFTSLNKPTIAVPGKSAQEVQAFVVGTASGPGAFTVYVYLFLTHTREAVVYVDGDRPRVDAQGYPDAEAEALAFVESMGFMVEPMNFRSLTPEQQLALMKSLPCFTKDLRAIGGVVPESTRSERSESPQARLARFLSAF